MSNEFIQQAANTLRTAHRQGSGATELGTLAKDTLGPAFGPVSFVAVFSSAFGIPIDVLQRALAWQGFNPSTNAISDEEFTDLLAKWLGESASE
ncbi:hypothetical protein JKV81_10765 [Streptomyces sp. For3]|uniref:hypothetical protein n=1 Tax=Streptomyces TaxID=1883 RepID=UPI00100DBF0C|nr:MULTISPECIES: hypothetical protein [Streptomyces]MBL1287321.1 hypothetical protein [Streptomyces silvae]